MSKKMKNFRDLGGISTSDGKKIRYGMLYRSGHLCSISSVKAEYLRDKKGIRTVVDLRSPSELSEHSDVLANGVRYIHLPPLNDEQNPSINKNNRVGVLKNIMAKEGGARRHLSDIYRLMVTQKESLEVFREWLRLLSDRKNTGVLWHCTQGKDRTGIAAAIILMTLGVDRKEIMRDYMRTNRSCAWVNFWIYIGVSIVTFSIYTAHSLNLLLSSRKFFLEAAFDEIDRVYGGTDGFLHNGLGLSDKEIQTLRDIYLT